MTFLTFKVIRNLLFEHPIIDSLCDRLVLNGGGLWHAPFQKPLHVFAAFYKLLCRAEVFRVQ